MSDFQKRAELWITRFPIGKRWKLLRYTIWIFTTLLILMVCAFPLETTGPMPFPSMLYYLWVFSFLLYVLQVFSIPYVVRWLGSRLRLVNSLFRKLAYALAFISFFSALNLFLLTGAFFYLSKHYAFHISEHTGFLLYLGCAYSSLNVIALVMMSRDLSERMSDSLRVLSNGMDMAAKLDFDAPIVTLECDEIGQVSNKFGTMAQMVKTRVSLLQALFNNIRIFSGLLSPEKILDHTLKTFASLNEAEAVVVAVLDEESQELYVVRSNIEGIDADGLRFTQKQGVLGSMINEPHFHTYTPKDYMKIAEDYAPEAKLWGKPNYVVSIPMLYKGKLKGAVVLYGMSLEDFHLEAKMDYFQGLTNQIANFLENARLYELVIRDRLTDLYVHSFIEATLEDLLAQAKRYRFPVCFVMLDVDKFKNINDQYGHPAGNKVLVALADVIKKVSRDADLPSRYGGDEFEIVLPHTDQSGGLVYAQKLRDAVEKMSLELTPGIQTGITISIGLAVYPQDVETSSQLQDAADDALYGAKEQGRNRVVAFSTLPK